MSIVQDWSKIINKCVRTKDGSDIGNLIANDQKSVTVHGKRIFKIPMECVDMYKGSELFLNIDFDEVYRYKIL